MPKAVACTVRLLALPEELYFLGAALDEIGENNIFRGRVLLQTGVCRGRFRFGVAHPIIEVGCEAAGLSNIHPHDFIEVYARVHGLLAARVLPPAKVHQAGERRFIAIRTGSGHGHQLDQRRLQHGSLIAPDPEGLQEAALAGEPDAAASQTFCGKGAAVRFEIAGQFLSPLSRGKIAAALRGKGPYRLRSELERIVGLHGLPRRVVLVPRAEAAGESQRGGIGAVQHDRGGRINAVCEKARCALLLRLIRKFAGEGGPGHARRAQDRSFIAFAAKLHDNRCGGVLGHAEDDGRRFRVRHDAEGDGFTLFEFLAILGLIAPIALIVRFDFRVGGYNSALLATLRKPAAKGLP